MYEKFVVFLFIDAINFSFILAKLVINLLQRSNE